MFTFMYIPIVRNILCATVKLHIFSTFGIRKLACAQSTIFLIMRNSTRICRFKFNLIVFSKIV